MSGMAVAAAFIVLGLLGFGYPQGAADLNWIIAGVVALLAGMWGPGMMMKK